MLQESSQSGDPRERIARDFLRRWDMTIDELQSFAPPVASHESLILCSSIVEGLANDRSDIDLIYMGEAELKGHMRLPNKYNIDLTHTAAGVEVNVVRLSPADLDDLGRRLAVSLEVLSNPRRLLEVKVEKDRQRLMFLHRIRNGVPIVNRGVFEDWRDRLRVDQLHRHLCLMALTDYLNRRQDVLGELQAGQIESASWIAKIAMMPRLAAAVLHAFGTTNVNAKWCLRLLRRFEGEIGADVVEGMLRFMRSPLERDPETLMAAMDPLCRLATSRVLDRDHGVQRAYFAFSRSVKIMN